MLALSRRMDEVIVMDLGDGRTVEIKVVGVMGGVVRLGIDAPDDVEIYRAETRTAQEDAK